MKSPTSFSKPTSRRQQPSVHHRRGSLFPRGRNKRRGLAPETLDELHPHHLVLSRSGKILQLGPALESLAPTLRTASRVDNALTFFQTAPLSAPGREVRIGTAELPLHDGFEVIALRERESSTLQIHYRVHFRDAKQEIWLLDTASPKATVKNDAKPENQLPSPPAISSELRSSQSEYLEALSALASGLSHEMNNSMMGILGNTELLGLSIEAPTARQRSMIDAIRENADRAANLCDQLLLFSGERPTIKEQLDATRFLDTLSIGESQPPSIPPSLSASRCSSQGRNCSVTPSNFAKSCAN